MVTTRYYIFYEEESILEGPLSEENAKSLQNFYVRLGVRSKIMVELEEVLKNESEKTKVL